METQGQARRAPLTYDDVRSAAEGLVATGVRVTQERVRAMLGGGSYATIGTLLRQWKATPQGAAASTGAPPELQRAVDTLWSQIETAHQQELEAARTAADEAVSTAQSAQALAEASCARAIEELGRANESLTALQAMNRQLEQQLADLRADSERRLADVRTDSERQIGELRIELTTARTKVAELEARTGEQATIIEAADRRLSAAQEQSIRQAEELRSTREALDLANVAHEQQKGKLAQLELSLARAESDAKAATETAETAMADLSRERSEALAYARRQAESHASLDRELSTLLNQQSETQKALADSRRESTSQLEELAKRLDLFESRLPVPKSGRTPNKRVKSASA